MQQNIGLDDSHFQDVLDGMSEEELARAQQVNAERTEEYRRAGILPLPLEGEGEEEEGRGILGPDGLTLEMVLGGGGSSSSSRGGSRAMGYGIMAQEDMERGGEVLVGVGEEAQAHVSGGKESVSGTDTGTGATATATATPSAESNHTKNTRTEGPIVPPVSESGTGESVSCKV
jgi:hypothetical protein